MKISFSTLGCPDWDLDTICERGREYGFDGVDFRGYLDSLDITLLPMFTTQVAETKRKLDAAGLAVSGISSSIEICELKNFAQNIEEAKRTIAVAHALDCKNVRIFAGWNADEIGHESAAKIGRECMDAILSLDGARDLHWLFETHEGWARASEIALLLERIPDPAFGLLWDVGNTAEIGGESPLKIIESAKKRIGYIHVKDAVYDPNHPQAIDGGWRYVNPGQGEFHLAEAILMLQEAGYDGWIVLEHEKRWHPEIQEPDEIFPAFARWIRLLLAKPIN